MGFFSSSQLMGNSTADCQRCKLHEKVKNPRLRPYGDGKAGLFVLGEAPGRVEDERGKPWQGEAGFELKLALREYGFSLFDDAVCLNAVNCRPPKNRTPTDHEIACCRPYVLKEISRIKPKVILGLGTPALHSLVGHRWKKTLRGVMRWRGLPIPDRDLKSWLVFTLHPSAVMRQSSVDYEFFFSHDIRTAIRLLKEPFPEFVPEVDCITYLEGSKRTDFLRALADGKWSPVVIDYETTGLKPHAEGHEIICCSIAVSPVEVYTFFVYDFTAEDWKLFRKFLASPRVKKIAHNMKFEAAWSEVRAGQAVRGWLCDTMLLCHIFDNRDNFVGLKVQAYIWFGLVDYDSHIEPYLKSDGDANQQNRIRQLLGTAKRRFELLTYCAFDSLLEYRLCNILTKLTGLEHIYRQLDKTPFVSTDYPPKFFKETYFLSE